MPRAQGMLLSLQQAEMGRKEREIQVAATGSI